MSTDGRTVTIVIVAPRHDAGSCEAVEGAGLYRLGLPPADADPTIDHAPPGNWE